MAEHNSNLAHACIPPLVALTTVYWPSPLYVRGKFLSQDGNFEDELLAHAKVSCHLKDGDAKVRKGGGVGESG